jgi:hypothetical protein
MTCRSGRGILRFSEAKLACDFLPGDGNAIFTLKSQGLPLIQRKWRSAAKSNTYCALVDQTKGSSSRFAFLNLKSALKMVAPQAHFHGFWAPPAA